MNSFDEKKILARVMRMAALGEHAPRFAHDTNNALAVISGNLQLIAEINGDALDADAREMMADATEAADESAEMASQLLKSWSTPLPDSASLDVKAFVEDFGSMMKRMIGDGIELDTRVSSDINCIHADADVLGYALLHVFYCTKAAMRGNGRLVFAANNDNDGLNQEDAGSSLESCNYVTISVTESLEADNSSADGQPNGLPGDGEQHLRAAGRLVADVNGELLVDSEPGMSTTVTFRFAAGLPGETQ